MLLDHTLCLFSTRFLCLWFYNFMARKYTTNV